MSARSASPRKIAELCTLLPRSLLFAHSFLNTLLFEAVPSSTFVFRAIVAPVLAIAALVAQTARYVLNLLVGELVTLVGGQLQELLGRLACLWLFLQLSV